MLQQSILGPFSWLAAPSNFAPSAETASADSISVYAFLLGQGVDVEALALVIDRARRLGVLPQRVLVTDNYLLAETYVRKLADWCEAEFIGLPVAVKFEPVLRVSDGVAVWRHFDSQLSIIAVDAESLDPREVAEIVRTAHIKGHRVGLATTETMRADRNRLGRRRLAYRASMALEIWRPEFAHRSGGRTWQRLFGLSAVAGGVAALIISPTQLMTWVFLTASVPLMGLGFLRTCALLSPSRAVSPRIGHRRQADSERVPDHLLPSYTVLVPLFREAPSLPQLVRALTQLDYPAAKLDIKLILESIDTRTIAAARQMQLPPWFQLVIVPDHPPRTKPKALNYALQLARGQLLVIYDAEDIPQPEQLRLAAEQFQRAPGDIISLQAALAIDNGAESWLTRQFAMEYMVLFQRLLPTYARFGIPLPLGGTSNHFVTAALKRVGGWDAFNVTEDADLGVRIARCGGRVDILRSATYEEAPPTMIGWFRQRTRWIKGFMATYLVHTREPARLLRDLGVFGFLGFHAVFLGMLVAILVHPLVYVAVAWAFLFDALPSWPRTPFEITAWSIAGINIGLGMAGTFGLTLRALFANRRLHHLPHLVLMPAYWLLISIAGYRALWQSLVDPFRWEKTEHGFARRFGQHSMAAPKKRRPANSGQRHNGSR